MSVINPSLVEIDDEGTAQGSVTKINFVGAGVTASVSGYSATVNIPAGGTSGRDGITIPAIDGEDGDSPIPIPGPIGPTGITGSIGLSGRNGIDGTDGIDGDNGFSIIGPQGIIGPNGVTGPQGIQGLSGLNGNDGSDGDDGLIGPIGPQGIQGIQGIQGVIGNTGPQGIQGLTAANGLDGTDGEDGQTIVGPIGPQGIQGIQGPNGTNGLNGAEGRAGFDGEDSDYPIMMPGAVGPTGNTGLTGSAGPTGFGPPGSDGIDADDALSLLPLNTPNLLSPIFLSNQSLVTPGAGFAADTYLVGSSIKMPQGNPRLGARYRVLFGVVKTAAGVATPIFTVRFGTAGSVVDTARLTFTFAAQTGVIDTGIVEISVHFRVVGTLAIIEGYAKLSHHLAATGLTTTGASGIGIIIPAPSGTFDSTIFNSIIGLSINGGSLAVWTVAPVQSDFVSV